MKIEINLAFINRDVTLILDYFPTTDQLADSVCALNHEQHVKFLNKIAENFNKKENSLEMQLEYIVSEKSLTKEARYLMSTFGDYAYHHFSTIDNKK